MKTGGELLKKWRADNNLSQGVAADMLKMSQSSVSDYESGESTPRIDQILRISVVTDGAVPPESWATKRARRSARRAA